MLLKQIRGKVSFPYKLTLYVISIFILRLGQQRLRQMVMDYMTWRGMFGNGWLIGIIIISVHTVSLRRYLIRKAPLQVMIQMNLPCLKKALRGGSFYVMKLIVQVIG